jgi:hypothetical protein
MLAARSSLASSPRIPWRERRHPLLPLINLARTIAGMANRRQPGKIDCHGRSPFGAPLGAGLSRRRYKDLAFYVAILLESFCRFSFAGPSAPSSEAGLFLHSPEPVLPKSAVNQLQRGETQLAIAMSFDVSGNVREAHVVKSSGVAAADEAVRSWIEVKWKARPEVMQKGFYRGRPVSSEFTCPMVLIRR